MKWTSRTKSAVALTAAFTLISGTAAATAATPYRTDTDETEAVAEEWSGQGESFTTTQQNDGTFDNPLIGADVPDVSTVRVPAEEAGEDRDVYYMVSTTMELVPGAPIMKSYDLVNWELVNYVYDELAIGDDSALRNGESAYGSGQWASSMNYHDGVYYVLFNSNNNGHAYLFSTTDVEDGTWERQEYDQAFHDPSLFFDDDGTAYIFYGYGSTNVVQLSDDMSTIVETNEGVLTADNVVNNTDYTLEQIGTSWEGFQLYQANDYYYALGITWAEFGRQAVVFRSKDLLGSVGGGDPYEIQIAVGTDAIAQGGFVSTGDPSLPDYALLFHDDYPTGRIPVLVPVEWDTDDPDAWPSFGNGEVGPGQVELPGDLETPIELTAAEQRLARSHSVVASDDFENDAVHQAYSDLAAPGEDDAPEGYDPAESAYNGSDLALQWEWNHNPDNRYWSLTDRDGWLRLTNGSIPATDGVDGDYNLTQFETARNLLSQRTFAPTSSAQTTLDVSGLKDGDTAGLAVYNRQLSYIAVRVEDGERTLGIVNRSIEDTTDTESSAEGVEDFLTSVSLPDDVTTVHLKADLDLRKSGDTSNTVQFLYSVDGEEWLPLGDPQPKLAQWEPSHFKGQRFGLFSYATEETGGYADFDSFLLSDVLSSDGADVDTADLEWLLDEADGLSEAGYTEESWAAVAEAASEAEALESPSTQNPVDAAAQELNAAIAALEPVADETGPEITVKDGEGFTVGADGLYAKVSFKLHDAGDVDRLTLNGVEKDLSDNVWSDLNYVEPGTFGATEGENELVVYDAAGNSTTLTFVLDTTGPTATVKDGEKFTSESGDGYDLVSYKLFDAHKVDKITLNGVEKDLSNNAWSDLNFIAPGKFGAVAGENTLVIYDVLGNSTTVTFTLN